VIHVLWGPGWTDLPFGLADARSTAPTGAWPSSHHSASALPGVRPGDDGPFPRSLEQAVVQGKVRGVRDSRPLGAWMDSSAWLFSRQEQVLPQRGHRPRPPPRRAKTCRAEGSAIAIVAPFRGPLETVCSGKGLGDSRPFEFGMDSSAFDTVSSRDVRSDLAGTRERASSAMEPPRRAAIRRVPSALERRVTRTRCLSRRRGL
jgi:hypothetical protein